MKRLGLAFPRQDGPIAVNKALCEAQGLEGLLELVVAVGPSFNGVNISTCLNRWFSFRHVLCLCSQHCAGASDDDTSLATCLPSSLGRCFTPGVLAY